MLYSKHTGKAPKGARRAPRITMAQASGQSLAQLHFQKSLQTWRSAESTSRFGVLRGQAGVLRGRQRWRDSELPSLPGTCSSQWPPRVCRRRRSRGGARGSAEQTCSLLSICDRRVAPCDFIQTLMAPLAPEPHSKAGLVGSGR